MFSELADFLIRADKGLFLLINGAHSAAFDSIMAFISKTISWAPLFLLMLYSIFRQYRWKGLLTLFFISATITLADQVSVNAFKEVFQRLRPCHDPDLRVLVHTVNGKCGGMYGFVSSHAANSFAIISFFLFSVAKHRRIWGIVLPFYAILVCYSRVYLGVHFPGDVLGGAILGCGIGLAMAFLHGKLQQSRELERLFAKSSGKE